MSSELDLLKAAYKNLGDCVKVLEQAEAPAPESICTSCGEGMVWVFTEWYCRDCQGAEVRKYWGVPEKDK